MIITDGQVSLVEGPSGSLTLVNQRDNSMVKPSHLNKWRSESGGIYLLNQDFSSVSTRTSTSGWYVRMAPVEEGGPLTVNSTLELEVTEL